MPERQKDQTKAHLGQTPCIVGGAGLRSEARQAVGA